MAVCKIVEESCIQFDLIYMYIYIQGIGYYIRYSVFRYIVGTMIERLSARMKWKTSLIVCIFLENDHYVISNRFHQFLGISKLLSVCSHANYFIIRCITIAYQERFVVAKIFHLTNLSSKLISPSYTKTIDPKKISKNS